MTGGGGKSRLRRFLVLSLFYRGGGEGNGFIAEKTILSQVSRGGPTFSGEVHPRGVQMLIAITITCDFLGRVGGGAPGIHRF